jgi:glutathione S-transferase
VAIHESLAICEWANERFPDAGLWVRRAQNRCTVEAANIAAGPCVMGNVDGSVAQANDPALTALHYALPRRHRYDQERSSVIWRNADYFVPRGATE